MSATDQREVTCECGRLKAIEFVGMTLTNLRCPFCPPTKPPPTLRVVQ